MSLSGENHHDASAAPSGPTSHSPAAPTSPSPTLHSNFVPVAVQVVPVVLEVDVEEGTTTPPPSDLSNKNEDPHSTTPADDLHLPDEDKNSPPGPGGRFSSVSSFSSATFDGPTTVNPHDPDVDDAERVRADGVALQIREYVSKIAEVEEIFGNVSEEMTLVLGRLAGFLQREGAHASARVRILLQAWDIERQLFVGRTSATGPRGHVVDVEGYVNREKLKIRYCRQRDVLKAEIREALTSSEGHQPSDARTKDDIDLVRVAWGSGRAQFHWKMLGGMTREDDGGVPRVNHEFMNDDPSRAPPRRRGAGASADSLRAAEQLAVTVDSRGVAPSRSRRNTASVDEIDQEGSSSGRPRGEEQSSESLREEEQTASATPAAPPSSAPTTPTSCSTQPGPRRSPVEDAATLEKAEGRPSVFSNVAASSTGMVTSLLFSTGVSAARTTLVGAADITYSTAALAADYVVPSNYLLARRIVAPTVGLAYRVSRQSAEFSFGVLERVGQPIVQTLGTWVGGWMFGGSPTTSHDVVDEPGAEARRQEEFLRTARTEQLASGGQLQFSSNPKSSPNISSGALLQKDEHSSSPSRASASSHDRSKGSGSPSSATPGSPSCAHDPDADGHSIVHSWGRAATQPLIDGFFYTTGGLSSLTQATSHVLVSTASATGDAIVSTTVAAASTVSLGGWAEGGDEQQQLAEDIRRHNIILADEDSFYVVMSGDKHVKCGNGAELELVESSCLCLGRGGWELCDVK